jgi:ribokinase
LTEGKDLFEAMRYANVTSALSVTKEGTAPSMPRRSEIDALLKESYGSQTN